MMGATNPTRSAPGRGRMFLAIGAAVVVVAGIIAFIVASSGGGDGSNNVRRSFPVAATPASLRALQSSVRHPVFWAGNRRGYTLELTRTLKGYIYIRYLPPGVQLGDDRTYLTVATYPDGHAFATLQKTGRKPDATATRLRGGGLAVTPFQGGTSTFIAYPNSPYLVEVYDPSSARARSLAASGRVRPV